MSAHTPGPWTVEKHAPFGWTIRGARERHLGEGTLLCQLSGYGADADARLIAAAPELLDALKALLEWAEEQTLDDRPHEVFDAREAIAKAEGES